MNRYPARELRPGVWSAGAEDSRGSTAAEAERAHKAYMRREAAKANKVYRAQAAKAAARDAKVKRCTLTYCTGAADTAAHRATRTHRNAEVYARSRRTSRY